ncbi:UTP:GlnB (protein PII) uridylyltransferase [Providencia alcalifaciens]|nr:UTP:GlnB (protein PII) uridylyltransferase [Providencia alcalifaciens]
MDGFSVELRREPSINKHKLYLVNVGGYKSSTLAELHDFDLLVAKPAIEVKQKALQTLLVDSQQRHKDNLKDVDDCVLLNKVGEYYIHLREEPNGEHFKPEWQGYKPIDI